MDKLTTILFLSFSKKNSISILSFNFASSTTMSIPLYLFLSCCVILFAYALLTFFFIFFKTAFFVIPSNSYTLGTTWEKWNKKKLKWWNGRECPIFIFDGLVELFLKKYMFAKCNIDFWIMIPSSHYIFLLDSQNTLLLKHYINSWISFLQKCSLDIYSTKIHSAQMDGWKHIVISSMNIVNFAP